MTNRQYLFVAVLFSLPLALFLLFADTLFLISLLKADF